MKSHVALAYALIPLLVIIVFIPDLVVYSVWSYKANAIAEAATKEAEIQGGFTPSVQQEVENRIKEYGLEGKGFTVNYSKLGAANQGERLTCEVKANYTFRAFNLLGTGVGHFTLPITSEDSGYSEVYYR